MTPTCPACGDSFPYNKDPNSCKKCGCPRSVAELGGRTVARWKKENNIVDHHPQSSTRRRHKHGMRGKKITTQKARPHYRRIKKRESEL